MGKYETKFKLEVVESFLAGDGAPCANMTCSTYPREFSEQRGRYDSPPTTEGIDARRQAHDRYGCTARSPQDE